MLTRSVVVSGFFTFRASMAWKYGRCRMSIRS